MKPSTNGSNRRKDRNNNRRGDRRPRASFQGLIPELPIIYPTDSAEYQPLVNSVHVFKEMISFYLVSHYGRGGYFIIDNNYYVSIVPVAPVLPYDKRVKTPVIDWEVYKAQNIENAREVKQLEDDSASWFAIIMGQVSPASKQLVQAHTDWVTADADNSPLLLLQIITAMHIVARSGNPAVDRRAAL